MSPENQSTLDPGTMPIPTGASQTQPAGTTPDGQTTGSPPPVEPPILPPEYMKYAIPVETSAGRVLMTAEEAARQVRSMRQSSSAQQMEILDLRAKYEALLAAQQQGYGQPVYPPQPGQDQPDPNAIPDFNQLFPPEVSPGQPAKQGADEEDALARTILAMKQKLDNFVDYTQKKEQHNQQIIQAQRMAQEQEMVKNSLLNAMDGAIKNSPVLKGIKTAPDLLSLRVVQKMNANPNLMDRMNEVVNLVAIDLEEEIAEERRQAVQEEMERMKTEVANNQNAQVMGAGGASPLPQQPKINHDPDARREQIAKQWAQRAASAFTGKR